MKIKIAYSFEAREQPALYAVATREVKSGLIVSAKMRAKTKKPKPQMSRASARHTSYRDELVNVYLYLLRLGFFFLGKRQAQHAILELRIDGFRIHVRRQRE